MLPWSGEVKGEGEEEADLHCGRHTSMRRKDWISRGRKNRGLASKRA
jgi:hypothetical protein